MPGTINIKTLGRSGVNVDKNALELDPDELMQAQNAVTDPDAGLKNRPGLVEMTDTPGAAAILGGIGVLEAAAGEAGGLEILYIGRGGDAP